MKKTRCILSLLFIISVFFSALPLSAQAYTISGFEVSSKTALLVSLDTGETMYRKNSDVKMFPASTTKIMSAVVVLENCKDIDKKITVPGYCISDLSGTGTTMGNLYTGENVTIRDLLHLMLICSAADAANTLADYVGGGSIDNFVEMMNEKAQTLEMKDTHFMNPHGLHDEQHYTTAQDLYKLSRHAMNLPVFMDICSKSRYTVAETDKNEERIISTTNQLIDPNTSYYYRYARGIKTGFTTPAGRCLVSTASKNGYNYMCIILGGDDDTRSEFSDTENLYEWAFDEFEYRKIKSKTDIVSEMNLQLCWEADHLQLFPENDISAVVPVDIDNSSIIFDPVLSENTAEAPIKKGTIMGYASVKCMGEEIARVNLVAGDSYERSWLLFTKKAALDIVKSQPFMLLAGALLVLLVLLIIVNIIHNRRRRRQRKRVKPIRKF